MLGIKELKKTYPSGVQALKGVSLEVPPGMFGLLGPNGAGKQSINLENRFGKPLCRAKRSRV